MNKLKYILFLLFIIIIFIFIINPLEKKIFKLYFYTDKRPLDKCVNSINNFDFECLGMPSGHTEVATIISLLLYSKRYINLPIAIIIILLVAFQRLLSKMHSEYQILIGFLLGLLYASIFIKLKKIFYIIIFILLLIFSLILIHLNIINKKIKEYPHWIDNSLNKTLIKKYNLPIYIKFIESMSGSYIEWGELEKYMDTLIYKIKQTNIKFDYIVGIKSGGAIITKYIADKLNLKYYYIKVSDKDDNCNKSEIYGTVRDIVKKKLKQNFKKEYIICEDIKENFFNKKVLLIDESIDSGDTINYVTKYLYTVKKSSFVLPCTILLIREEYKNKFVYLFQKPNTFIWSWGFAN